MKADYEPWWQFEGWEENIVSTNLYMSKEQFEKGLKEILQSLRMQYSNEICREQKFYAFWSEEEREFCEACDDDIQIYHGLIIETVI